MDTSSLVKLYVEETGSTQVRVWLEDAGKPLYRLFLPLTGGLTMQRQKHGVDTATRLTKMVTTTRIW